MSIIKITCDACGCSFERKKSEFNRSLRLGRKQFCSTKCSALTTKFNLGKHLGAGRPENLKGCNKERNTKYSRFKYFLKKARSRHRDKSWPHPNLTLTDLDEIWTKQQGRCALSGLKLFLPHNTTAWQNNTRCFDRASLDRIDCNKPYTKGNVRFVCFMANICRNNFSDEEVINFCKAVARHHS